jgi:hypothetical protein
MYHPKYIVTYNEHTAKRNNKQLFPTPESPMITILNKSSLLYIFITYTHTIASHRLHYALFFVDVELIPLYSLL